MAEHSGLDRRLRALEDERDILALLHRTCAAVDADVVQDWLDCFAPDGRFCWARGPAEPPLLDVRGAYALGTWLVEHRKTHPVGSQTHVLVQPVVALTGDRAEVSSTYLTLKSLPDGDLVIASSGRYADRVGRSNDSRWRIVERRSIGIMRREQAGAR